MLPELLPGENLEDPSHPFYEVYTKWNIHHSAELENPEKCSDKKKEKVRRIRKTNLKLKGTDKLSK